MRYVAWCIRALQGLVGRVRGVLLLLLEGFRPLRFFSRCQRSRVALPSEVTVTGPLGKLERPPVHLLGARPAPASSGEEVQDGGESLRDLLERERGLRRLRRRVRLDEAERGNGGVVADRHRVRGASENRVEREVP